MAWIAYDIGSRRKHVERLARQIRFTSMAPAEVIECTQVNHFIRNSPYCRNRVLEAVWLVNILTLLQPPQNLVCYFTHSLHAWYQKYNPIRRIL